MPAVLASRVNYHERQFIRLAEMCDEQAYHRQLHRRHNLTHHAWGIVAGLELVVNDGLPQVRAGFAVDGYGRDLLLVDRQVFTREVFDRLGATRLDLWLEYRLDAAGADAPRATERAEVVAVRGGSLPDPRRPPGVPSNALEEPLLDTPDDPRRRWPVYLGRVAMSVTSIGAPSFLVVNSDRVYTGIQAEAIDHPGNASRVEIGRRSTPGSDKQIGDITYQYAEAPRGDFRVFVPDAVEADPDETVRTLQPTLAISGDTTQVRGNTEIHGDLVMDGAALQFMQPSADADRPDPAIYRSGDELRIDLGSLQGGARAFSIGVMNGSDFMPALELRYDPDNGGSPVLTVHGDLRIEGTIDSDDVRTRTVTGDVATMLSAMLQSAIAAA